MKFRGQKPALVEVVVDGIVVATRHLSGQAEQVQFNLQNAGLAPGSHEATIRLYDAQGRLLGEQRTRLNLLPDPNSPLTILMPRNGSQVAGITPIEVRVPRQSGVYVSFFIDGQIRGLRNYPPYVYNWDTNRETNGWHTIEVWSYDGNQTLKTPPMRVYVNNPSGRTERQLPAEPERLSAEAEPAVAAAESTPAVSDGSLRVALAPESRLSERVRLSAPAAPAPAPVEPSVSPAIGEPTTAPTVNAPATAHLSANRLSAPLDEPSLQAVQHAPMQAVHLARAVEVEPQMRGQKLRAPQVVSTPPAAPAKAPAHNSAWLSLEPGVRLPASITQFEVMLDAALLSFDVPPQVEEGVALVPIRAVLEHLGASLRWDHQRKVVYAELNGRQITLRVRENAIQVDGAPVPAEASLRIVRGRVLVPATALRELLGAEVAFDLAAQQLVINTEQRAGQ
ncbi:MAG: stalk domain-containing protein [Fimbriimonadales bacterium]|nr:stalk domain-containing protein [Fimbriimonadales bacterium]